MAMGIHLEPGQVAMRCNLVTVEDGRMVSYSAGNITSDESAELVAALREGLGIAFSDESAGGRLGLHAGVGFRHILTVRDGVDLLATEFVPPHNITDQEVAGHDPTGPGADLVRDLMERSKPILAAHPVNKARVARGLPPATQIWLFWPGMEPARMPTFHDSYGERRAALTSAVDLLRGLARQTGIDCLDIPGVTDGGDNDFAGQMAAAVEALADYDVVFVHVEAPDEMSHAGDAEGKVRAIEQVDALMVPQVTALNEAAARRDAPAARPGEAEGVRLLVMPDHPTPLEIKTHVHDPVPFVLWGPGFGASGAEAFTETEARATGFAVAPGHLLMSLFLDGSAG